MLKILKNENLQQNSEWHAIPATLMASESIQNAKIKHYFKPSIHTTDGLSACIQGRLLKGRSHNMPNLYKACTYKSDDLSNDVELVITERVGEIIDWRKDIPWGQNEGYIGTINKYSCIQKALHS